MASAEFEQAVEAVQGLTDDPGNDVKLRLYGLFKQATREPVGGIECADARQRGEKERLRTTVDAWIRKPGRELPEGFHCNVPAARVGQRCVK